MITVIGPTGCGQVEVTTFRTDAERAEMYDPEGDGPSVICCPACGTARGYVNV